MPVTADQLASFHDYALQRLRNGGAVSMRQLLEDWEAAAERADVIQAVEEGEAEFAAGGGQSVEEAFSEVRKQLGWE